MAALPTRTRRHWAVRAYLSDVEPGHTGVARQVWFQALSPCGALSLTPSVALQRQLETAPAIVPKC